jgi:thiamine phosphate synthase YjbQ (UPF0047 family)
MDLEREILARVSNTKDFFGSVFFRDTLDDWNVAKDLGEFLVRILPDSEVMGHALLARAHRHLGNRELALDELKQCQARTANRKLEPWETEMLLPLLTEEEKHLSESAGPNLDKA